MTHLRRLGPLLAVWALTRALVLLTVWQVVTLPGPDVTTDVSVIYRGWAEVLEHGAFPQEDVSWQYPPGAALAVLAPRLLPFWDYATAFFALAVLADALTLGLLVRAARRPERRRAGAWVWVAGVPLLGPTAYARYDLMVTAVAVAALLAAVRHPRLAGALAGCGALLKVWPVLLLTGVERGRRTLLSWGAAAVTGLLVTLGFAATMPGAFAFLTFQRDRGVEVESLGALVFHLARHAGWEGTVLLNYGSVEFLGPQVDLVGTASLGLSGLAFGWLAWWRLRAVAWTPHTLVDAAFAAVLLFTTTSRVISPQYLLWLVGLAAVACATRGGRQRVPAALVLAATGVTTLEFPIWFAHVVASDALGVTLLALRNGLLVVASVWCCAVLWRSTVTEPRRSAGAAPPDEGPATERAPGPPRTGRPTPPSEGPDARSMLSW